MSVNDEYNLYLYVRNRSIDRWDAYGLFLNFLKDFKPELPSLTFEVSSPVPVLWGGYPFGVVEIGLPGKNGSQDITIAVGINWNLSKLVNKFLHKKIIPDKFSALDFSGFLEGNGSYKCGCFDFCEISLGGALSLGEGRRGGRSEGYKNFQELDTRYSAVAGVSVELRGTVNLCKGMVKGTLTVVATMGFKAPGFTLFGYGFNPSFEVNFTLAKDFKERSVPELKLFKPCD